MPIIIILGILAGAGAIAHAERDRGYHYTNNDMDNMLKDMTGKSKKECQKILKRYGRR